MQLGALRELSWMDEILPEFVWLGLLVDRFGLRSGISILEATVVASKDVLRKDQQLWLALTSAYQSLDPDQKSTIAKSLDEANVREDLALGIAPLVVHYPECPLAFLVQDSPNEGSESIEKVRAVLAACMNRWSEPGTHLQIMAVYTGFIQGRLIVPKDSLLAKFPAVEAYPTTDESRLIASACRATINSLFTQDIIGSSAEWCTYFWRRGLELEQCSPIDVSDE